jgi:hypothetical protein
MNVGDHAVPHCPHCTSGRLVTALRTVHCLYCFCDACGGAWALDRLVASGHQPERRCAGRPVTAPVAPSEGGGDSPGAGQRPDGEP